jgi:sugar lactone lactonase YvrE
MAPCFSHYQKGLVYVTEAFSQDSGQAKLWLMGGRIRKQLMDDKLSHPSGMVISPDGQWLTVADSSTDQGYTYHVRADGVVGDREAFYQIEGIADSKNGNSLAMDRFGWLYAATSVGVQVFDQVGRMRAILAVPGGAVTSVAFGGVDFGTLYVTCADQKIYRRKLNGRGMPSWAPPIEVQKAGL